MKEFKRNSMCGTISNNEIEKKVILNGWVQRRRDLGAIIFIDLRDRTGIVQLVFNPEINKDAHDIASKIRNEFVIGVIGTVKSRGEKDKNKNMATGDIEIIVDKVTILNPSLTPPFMLDDSQEINDENRMKYRYLDLRRPTVQNNIIMRHKVINSIRNFFNENGFLDIETPILNKSTPEGARDFLVPSRIHQGKFYALPQSPQIFKQILMISGFDKYYQIVKCFRDEDFRTDRQLEFTQLDVEMSFVEQEDIITMISGMCKKIVEDSYGKKVELPIPRITWKEAMEKYGSDKPDMRFDLQLHDISDIAVNSDFKVFRSAIDSKGIISGITCPNGDKFSRKDIDELTALIAPYGAKGLAWMRVKNSLLESSSAKFFSEDLQKAIIARMDAKEGDLLLFVADKPKIVYASLGFLRQKVAERLNLIDKDALNFLWVVDFPLFEYNEEDNSYVSMHHAFTSPNSEDIPYLKKDPSKVRAASYDITLNGVELGSGSIRIHDQEMQSQMFDIIGLTREEAADRFGFLLDALKYGAPPHGGIALGMDRLLMILQKEDSIREVIAFPKTYKGVCMMSSTPSTVKEEQLKELGIKVDI